jgi:type II secretory pathway pseudopilin PulG
MPVIPNQSDQPVGRPPSRNIFEDPAIAASAQNDPFARWVIAHWRTIVVVLAAIAAGMLGYNRYTTVRLEKLSAATAVLRGVQESYKELLTKDESLSALKSQEAATTDAAEREKLKGNIETTSREVDQLRDKVTLMVDALDQAPPYSQLKTLYQGLLAARVKDYDKVQGVLAMQAWEQAGEPESRDRFMAEMLSLGLARSLIDSDVHRDFARGQLAALAERGSFAAVQAANALLLIAQSDADKKQAEELVAKVRMKFPAQQRFLSNSDSE